MSLPRDRSVYLTAEPTNGVRLQPQKKSADAFLERSGIRRSIVEVAAVGFRLRDQFLDRRHRQQTRVIRCLLRL
jgi:hypothetical protein